MKEIGHDEAVHGSTVHWFFAEGDGRLHDVCLNEHGFVSLDDARAVFEAWGSQYNQERPRTSLYRLMPPAWARQCAVKSAPLAKESEGLRY